MNGTPVPIPPGTTAVLVIDVQQGLCEGPHAAHDCPGLIRHINAVTRKARAAGAPVVFIQHESRTGYLEHGTREWQLADGLETGPGDHYIRKTTPDSFLRTELQPLLQRLGVRQVAICGMHSEFCVDTTTRRALALGLPVLLVEDGHSSAGNAALAAPQVIAHHNATLSNIQSFGPRATLVRSEALAFAAA